MWPILDIARFPFAPERPRNVGQESETCDTVLD